MKGTSGVYPTEEFVVSSLLLVRGMTVPVRHVQASTEACQTIECNFSFQICVILCRRLGSRNDLLSVMVVFVSYTSNLLEPMYDFQIHIMFLEKYILNLQDLPKNQSPETVPICIA